MQAAAFYWQGITEPLLHVHEKKLQIVRGQQVELHLLWHCQQLVLLLFHDKKKRSLFMLEGKKTQTHTLLLCLGNAEIWF